MLIRKGSLVGQEPLAQMIVNFRLTSCLDAIDLCLNVFHAIFALSTVDRAEMGLDTIDLCWNVFDVMFLDAIHLCLKAFHAIFEIATVDQIEMGQLHELPLCLQVVLYLVGVLS